MLSSIGWILVASSVITAGGGLAALFAPHLFLRFGFAVENPATSAVFFVRHWGVLIFAVAGLIVYSAYAPATRTPILIAAAIEKFAMGLMVFFGPVKRTPAASWREGVQSGPEQSRARSLRRSEPLTARTDLSPFRQEGKGAVV